MAVLPSERILNGGPLVVSLRRSGTFSIVTANSIEMLAQQQSCFPGQKPTASAEGAVCGALSSWVDDGGR